MKCIRILFCSAAAAALTLPQIAAANGANCGSVKALLSTDPAEFAKVAVVFTPSGKLDVTYGGATDLLQGATQCEFNEYSTFELACRWNVGGDEAAAQSRFDAIRQGLLQCIVNPRIEESESTAPISGSGLTELKKFEANVGRDERQADMQLFRVVRGKKAEFFVTISFSE